MCVQWVSVQILQILKCFLSITNNHSISLGPGTKPKLWLERWNKFGGRIEAHPFLGFLRILAELRCFQAKLALAEGMKVVPHFEIFNSAIFENF